jgi:crotonobetainyl-CoA:carnitine CoA-transferase CaiB-like acyl-CoA transferase
MGILTALYHRTATGLGQHVETDLMSCSLASLVNQSAAYAGAGTVAKPLGNRHPSIAPYEVFRTAAGELAVAAGNDSLYRRFCGVLELPELVDDPRFRTNPERVAHRDELIPVIEERLATRTADEWFELLREVGVPAGPVNDMAGAFSFAERLGLDPVVDVEGSRSVRNPVRMSATPATYRSPAPRLS